MDLTTALQETLNLLKRKESIKRALELDLIDNDEARHMGDKLEFEYAVLRTIYLLPAQPYEVPESSQTGV